uniref:PX domain-containing protein n=1 Tax=Rhizochromulina marina TaxID=1034831 RepID=A0A6U1B056_9STRA|mmetsp:Transcript_26893/g.78299  ORF Transcript_26893/g.78299 Transcript_26893/m.78299 type:complete len:301 (+) Transcript_26893:473-1375(+)|eukprot:CAMPEP_0118962396 /NCGR_PEP_ID=MMETSP1173-20130426/747_1 /TAXON_ID=1034831 /ORGANISM="Rhizochromulina marina cf, Strain CCMP1243" /LENGTH=300 /DNA_ID=CAMNT_0006910655 /DNA_START=280 /DNA_END=1182 /DNA_ORIENTATION=+
MGPVLSVAFKGLLPPRQLLPETKNRPCLCCTHRLGLLLAERASNGSESQRQAKAWSSCQAPSDGPGGGLTSPPGGEPGTGGEWGFWVDPHDSESEHLMCSPALSAHPPLESKRCVGDLPAHLFRESLSTQALWQVAGTAQATSAGSEDVEMVSCLGEAAHEVISEVDNSFGCSVSKTFVCEECGNVSNTAIRIPKFQVVKSGNEQFAEFLVVIELGIFTFGVWRRYSEFVELANTITRRRELFPNSHFSWQCMCYRKRWFRCLDPDYLTIKCFLLERFLHDCICESSDQTHVLKFIGMSM